MATLSTIFSGGIGVTTFVLAWAYMIWQFLSFTEGTPLMPWWPF